MRARPPHTMKPLLRFFIKVASTYIRRMPDHSGRWRLERRLILLSSHLRGHLPPRTIRTRHGFKMTVDGNSQAGRILYVTGRCERQITSLIETLFHPAYTVIDGGAHIGFFSILASRQVAPTGTVVAFEPTPGTSEIVRANLAHNECTKVTGRPEAVVSQFA